VTVGGTSSRDKGKRWEREVARLFRDAMPGETVKRGFQSRFGGSEEADVECPIYHIEAKHQQSVNIWASMRQARDDASARGLGKVPVVVAKRDARKDEPIAVLRLVDFLDLVEERHYLDNKS